MFSFPAALLFGILGIANDRRKSLAIATTLITAGLILLWVFIIAVQIFRH